MAKPSVEAPRQLRTLEDIATAHEELFERQRSGQIDPKTADALNTTLKGIVYLNVKMRLEMLKLVIHSQVKKLDIPQSVLESLPIKISG